MKQSKQLPRKKFLPVQSLRSLIERRANETPDLVCFQYRRGSRTVAEVTYKGFWEDVRALATYLLRHRVRGFRIAILSENSYQWLAAYFAIVVTGNVAVLLAKDAPDTEIAAQLSQSDTQFVLYSDACADKAEYCRKIYGLRKPLFPMHDLEKWVEKGQTLIRKGKNLFDNYYTDPDAMCTIFFTSGSTGFSKGVMISQSNMCSNVDDVLHQLVPHGPSLAVLPFHHAFGLVAAVLLPIHLGVIVFICSGLNNFMREVQIAKPRTMALVPLFVETFSKTIWRTAKKEGQERKLKMGMMASDAMLKVGIDRRRELFGAVLSKFGGTLECIVCGGAPLDPRYVKEFHSLGVEIINGYGITECSPVVAVNQMEDNKAGSVGHVLPQTELRIDDPDESGSGEIVVRGPNVMLGYYKDENATVQVMEEDGWFHTGDLGRLDENGFLYITGRKKSLIIRANGENVSPEELEQYVERIEEVSEVVVYEEGNLITAEIYSDQTERTPEELRAFLQKQIDKLNAKLPSHKHIQQLKIRATEFEKTATRKIKRFKAVAQSAQQNIKDRVGGEKEE